MAANKPDQIDGAQQNADDISGVDVKDRYPQEQDGPIARGHPGHGQSRGQHLPDQVRGLPFAFREERCLAGDEAPPVIQQGHVTVFHRLVAVLQEGLEVDVPALGVAQGGPHQGTFRQLAQVIDPDLEGDVEIGAQQAGRGRIGGQGRAWQVKEGQGQVLVMPMAAATTMARVKAATWTRHCKLIRVRMTGSVCGGVMGSPDLTGSTGGGVIGSSG